LKGDDIVIAKSPGDFAEKYFTAWMFAK